MRWGAQFSHWLLRNPCFEYISAIAPGSRAGSSPFSIAASKPSFISAFDFPANANLVRIIRIGTSVLAACGLQQTGPRLLGFQNSGLFSNWSIPRAVYAADKAVGALDGSFIALFS